MSRLKALHTANQHCDWSVMLGFLFLMIRTSLEVTVISEYIPEFVSDSVWLLAMLLLMYSFWKKKKLEKEGHIMFDSVALCIGIMCYVLSGETIPLTNIVLLLVIRRCGGGKSLTLIWMGIVSMLLLGGLLEFVIQTLIDPEQLRVTVKEGGESATALLFSHPNMCAGFMLMLEIAALLIVKRQVTPVRVVLTGVIGLLILLITKSKTSFMLAMLITVIYAFGMFKRSPSPKFAKYVYKLVAILPIMLIVMTFLIAGPFFQDGMETFLTNRVGLWRGGYLENGIALFGNRLVNGVFLYAGGAMHIETLDSAYAEYLFVYGLAPFGITYYLWLSGLKENEISRCPFTCIMLAIVLLYGITETYGLNLLFAFPLVIPCASQACFQPKMKEWNPCGSSDESARIEETV